MKLLFIVIAGLLLLSCAKPRVSSVTVSYAQCTQFEVRGNILSLCYDSLNDSRCPPAYICIWSGDAVARFRFTAHTQHAVALSLYGSMMGVGNDTTVEGYHLRLVDLPFPTTPSADKTAIVEIK